MTKIVATLSLVFSLGLLNWSIVQKEHQLSDGRMVYLELAPVDPRSLMQGDYMALNFKVAVEIRRHLSKNDETPSDLKELMTQDGYVVVTLDQNRIGQFKRLASNQADEQALSEDEMLLKYRIRDDAIKFATNAFFFQEGHADIYDNARFGQFRVSEEGELLLSGMYDEQLRLLEAVSDESL
ncbi:GDYXXLXY domain-containing protein [Litoribacillus peritrichatus]|uniref:GDYXXLXY domain-containing protein n=1 Tax=Litoribacillus peritrichatus TaxID=718191 RepID=A0ABP7MB01_9GAMM